jgi:hypothetical protein
MPRYDNIFLTDTATSYKFSSAAKVVAAPKIPKRPNLKEHSDKLLEEFRNAQRKFEEYEPQQATSITHKAAVYVEFSGAEDYVLLSKSLEDSRHGIKLLNVREIVSRADDEFNEKTTTRATVYIPKGKETIFIQKISEFATMKTNKGFPKNNDLVSSIESINDAINIGAFWIGNSSDIPNDTKKWFEIWVDVTEKAFEDNKNEIFAILDTLGMMHGSKTECLKFPERLVIPVFANRKGLLDLAKNGVRVAEIRKLAIPNSVFIDSALSKQSKWANDLLKRTVYNDTGVSVCILDTGVNREHELITPFMPTASETIEKTWGTVDNNGHGTNMAGVVLYNDLRSHLLASTPLNMNHIIESVKILEPNAPVTTKVE